MAILMASPVFGQQPETARQYFNELRDANALNQYLDKYVCFSDDNEPGFAVVSTVEDIVDAMTRNGDKEGAKVFAKAGEGLFVQDFYKGVASGDPIFYDKTTDGKYSLDYDAPIHHGRTVYLINWKTGRYRLQVYALDHSKNLPAAEGSGKCELIHPGDTPSVAGVR